MPEGAGTAEPDRTEDTTATSPDAEASPQRMTTAAIQALPVVGDNICREYASKENRTLNRCEFLGPYQGEIATPSAEQERATLENALLACESDITCMGVSTDWYTGADWYTVRSTEAFLPNEDSYGCSFVINCP